MNNLRFTLFLLLFSAKISAQSKPDTDLLKVVSLAIRYEHKIFLSSQLDSGTIQQIKEKLSGKNLVGKAAENLMRSDSLILSLRERKYIDSLFTIAAAHVWTKPEIEQCGIFNFSLINLDTRFEAHRRLQPKQAVYQLMLPIFLRNNTICLFYSDFYVRAGAAEAAFAYLKKRMINGTLR